MAEAFPIYVLAGKDQCLRDAARAKLLQQLIGDADPQTCLSQFDGDAELAAVFDELRTMPFLAPHRVVIVRDASPFVSAHRDALETYLEKPAASGTLILIVDSWPKNTRLAKRIDKAAVFDCAAPEKGDLRAWILDAAKQRGKRIDAQAAEMLAEGLAGDLAMLSNELDKLATYLGDEPNITPELVTALVALPEQVVSFALTDAIAQGDTRRAIQQLNAAFDNGEEPIRIMGQMGWFMRKAYSVAIDVQGGMNIQAAKKKHRIFSRLEVFFRRRPINKLQGDLRRLLTADLGSKSGLDPKVALQQLVFELTQ